VVAVAVAVMQKSSMRWATNEARKEEQGRKFNHRSEGKKPKG
jgi:hypothetical protein